jgi:hypothetical protein
MEYRNKTIAFFPFLLFMRHENAIVWSLEFLFIYPYVFRVVYRIILKKKTKRAWIYICCFNYYDVKLRHTMDCYSKPGSSSFFLSLNNYPFQSLNIFFQFCPPMLYSHGFKPNNLFRFVYYGEFTVSKNVLALH